MFDLVLYFINNRKCLWQYFFFFDDVCVLCMHVIRIRSYQNAGMNSSSKYQFLASQYFVGHTNLDNAERLLSVKVSALSIINIEEHIRQSAKTQRWPKCEPLQ